MKYSEINRPQINENRPHMKKNTSYWISPTGRIMDLNGGFHISFVVEQPRRFGLSDEYIERIYKQHGEWGDGTQLGEGKAREEIIMQLTQKGWIRMRLYLSRNASFWSVTLNDLSGKTKDHMYEWAQMQMKVEGMKGSAHMPVKFGFTGSDTVNNEYTVMELSQDALMAEEATTGLVIVETVEGFDELPLYDFAKE